MRCTRLHRARRQRLAAPRERAREHERLVGVAELRALGEQALAGALDLVEDAHAAVPRQRELDREVGADDVDERPGALEQRAGAGDLVADEVADRVRDAARGDVGLGDAEVAEILGGQVDAAALPVARGRPGSGARSRARVDEILGVGVELGRAVAADVEQQAADRLGGLARVAAQLVERRVAAALEVGPEPGQQLGELGDRQRELDRRCRRARRTPGARRCRDTRRGAALPSDRARGRGGPRTRPRRRSRRRRARTRTARRCACAACERANIEPTG